MPTPSLAPLQVWPVIHLTTTELALKNVAIAEKHGCSGVFIISMDGEDSKVLPVAVEIKKLFPNLLVGVNLLGSSGTNALRMSLEAGLDATWTDKPEVTSQDIGKGARQVQLMLQQHPTHQFFGSVAFKYQAEEAFPDKAAQSAQSLGMTATTSGKATGIAPAGAKLKLMRSAIGNAPLALASGVAQDNVTQLGEYLTHILVSTGISKTFYEFDENKIKLLMLEVNRMNAQRVTNQAILQNAPYRMPAHLRVALRSDATPLDVANALAVEGGRLGLGSAWGSSPTADLLLKAAALIKELSVKGAPDAS